MTAPNSFAKKKCIYHTIQHHKQKLILSNEQIIMGAAFRKSVRCDSVALETRFVGRRTHSRITVLTELP